MPQLDDAERWVIREVFSLIPPGPFGGNESLVAYIIHKCEKNGVSPGRCAYILDLFDLHDIDCTLACPVCRRLENYHAAT